MNRKCCIYCRIDGESNDINTACMERQRDELRSAAEKLGLEIAAERLAYESGLDPRRQSIKTLIRDARHGVYSCVLVKNISRLSRSVEGAVEIGNKFNRCGLRVYTPDGQVQLAPSKMFYYSRYNQMKEG